MGSSADLRWIIVDTDPGSDDALSLLQLLRNPMVHVLAITCVHGNTGVEQTTENALRLLQFCKRCDVPVYKGCYSPLLVAKESDSYHGSDGWGGFSKDYPLPETSPLQEEHAAVAIARLVKEHPKKITLVAIGPLTNLAMAHRLDATFSDNLKDLTVMGGNIEGKGNITATTEFNFYCDPEAADIVLREFRCPIQICPWEVCLKHSLPWDWYRKWTTKNTPTAEFIAKITSHAVNVSHKRSKRPGYHCCDLLATTVVLYPQLVTKRVRYHVTVELRGDHTRGMMVIDSRPHSVATPNVEICMEIDLQSMQDVWEKLTD